MEHLIITIIQTIGFAIIWRMAGSGYKELFAPVGGLLLALSVASLQEFVWLFYALMILRTLPTGKIFAAIHGVPQGGDRDVDFKVLGRVLFTYNWSYIADVTEWINKKLPALPFTQMWYRYGIIYAAVRNSLALPFIILSGHYGLVVFLLAGFVYYGFGRLEKRYPKVQSVREAELVQGGVFGLLI